MLNRYGNGSERNIATEISLEDKGSSGPERRANSVKRGEENLHEGSAARQTSAGEKERSGEADGRNKEST